MPGQFPHASRQFDLLRFIAGYLEASDGVSPSFAECASGIGLRSKGSTARLIAALERRGAIRRLPCRHRTLALLHPVAIPRAPDGAPLWLVPLAPQP